jgi:phosphatidate cytidylyltransferase
VLAARVATAAALIAALLAALFFLPPTPLAVLVAALVAGGAFEWARLCRLGRGAAWGYAALVAGVFIVLWNYRFDQAAFIAAAVFWIAVVPMWLAFGVRATHGAVLLASGFLVLVPAGLAMATIGAASVLLVLVLVWLADTAAYFVGSRWGRHKLAPGISPGKTWEGAAGGIAGALAYAALVALARKEALAGYLVVAALLGVLSMVGDLFESAAKRQAEVKDSGALLPGHGGIMDRIDSATATLPVAALLLSLPNP